MVSRRLRFGTVLTALAAASLACMTLAPTPPPAPTAIRVPTGGTPRVITSTPPPTQPATATAQATAPAATLAPSASPAPTQPPATATAVGTPGGLPAGNAGPVQLHGRFAVTNALIFDSYVEHAVSLIDLHGFVIRDPQWELPVASQVLGYMDVDQQQLSGTYTLNLPAQPLGTLNDVDQNKQTDTGVQLFAVAYSPNLAGGPFSEGDDPSFGWPSYLATLRTDPENKNEIIGGKLVVWAPDDKQAFPTGFGPDGKLFTADDPTGPLPAGYSVIDLDQKPFAVQRQAVTDANLYEPKDIAVKDFSGQSYTEAFQNLYDLISKTWAFNGRPEKTLDWSALHDRIAPQVAQAEKDKDPQAFYQALFDFTQAIPDGHVGLSGALASQAFSTAVKAGYGFSLRQLDDGQYTVVFVTPGGPAEQAGVKVGAQVQQFNGQPIATAVAGAKPFLNLSQAVFLRYQQARYLTRAPQGKTATVTFVNPGDTQPQTVSLTAAAEQASFGFTSFYHNYAAPELPVTYRLLDSGLGYIQIATNSDDLNLLIRLFERALQTFEADGVKGVIIDLRYNSGGAPLGLAGFLTDQPIPTGQDFRYSSPTGKYEPLGPAGKILPNKTQYRFDQLAVLVGPGCFSACEFEAYGFAQLPGAEVVGFYSSEGVFANVAPGQVKLPEGLDFQFSTDRTMLGDKLFLEGTGVVPTIKVPLTLENVTTTDDIVLQTAEKALGAAPATPSAATATPVPATPTATAGTPATPTRTPRPGAATATPSPSATPTAGAATATPKASTAGPTIGSAADAEAALQAQAQFLEDAAKETYDPARLSQAGQTYSYTITLKKEENLIWMNGWCATTQAILTDNYKHITLTFAVNGQPLDLKQLAVFDGPNSGQYCRMYYTVLSHWPADATRLENAVTFDKKLNDGTSDYPAGTHHYVYTVTGP